MIIFERFELTNFRRYLKTTIDFSKSKDNNLNVILARNGVGKSTLFDSLTWCLFGIEDHLKIDPKYKKESERLINTSVVSSLKEGKTAEVIVTIYLTDLSQKTKYKIERKCTFHKGKGGILVGEDDISLKPPLVMKLVAGTEWTRDDTPETVIDSLIPKDLRQFFFFDGEQLRTHFETNTNDYIRKKIEAVSRVDLLDGCLGNLESYDWYISKRKRPYCTNSELSRQEDKRGRIADELKKDREKLKRLNAELRGIKSELDQIKKQRIDVGADIKTIALLDTQYDTAKSNKDVKVEEQAELRKKYQEYLTDTAPFIFLEKNIVSAVNLINHAVENKEAPPPITKDYLNRLVTVHKECICGESLKDPKDKHTLKLLNLIKDTEASVSVNFSEGMLFYDQNKVDPKLVAKRLSDYRDNDDKLEEAIKKISLQITELEHQRARVDSNLHIQLQKREKELEKKRDGVVGEIPTVQDRIDSAEIELSKVSSEIDKNSKGISALRALNDKQKLATETAKFMSIFRNTIVRKNTDELKKKTEVYLRQILTEKSDEIKTVDIDEDFDLKIISTVDPSINLRHTLSAGETQIFVLAFATALRDITCHNAPLVIDTPLGKIDEEYRLQVVSAFPKILERAQLILLVTSSEYTKEIRSEVKALSKSLVEYEIKKDGIKNTTRRL